MSADAERVHPATMDEDATALAAETEAFLKERLRERFPYMKQIAFDALVNKTVRTLQTGVEKKCVSIILHTARHG